MRGYRGSVFGLAVLAALPAMVQESGAQESRAQEPGDAEAGHELAAKLCAACHIVGDERRGSDQAPPFPVIARNPRLSLAQLHGWGGPGHPMLPDLALTPQQVADINAYLDRLRGIAPPAQPAPPPGKPVLPQAPPDRIGPPIGEEEPAPE